MRIIRKGTKEPPVYRGECYKCGCVFEEDADKLSITYDQRDGSFVKTNCPQCGAQAFMHPVKER